jgi:large subunit ribosomal protein L9
MKEQNGIDIDKKKLKLDESIKAVGTYEVPVKLHKEVTAKLKVTVESL